MSSTGKFLLGPWLKDGTGTGTGGRPPTRNQDGFRKDTSWVVLPVKNILDGLSQALAVIKERDVTVVQIETRRSRNPDHPEAEYDIFMEIKCDGKYMKSLVGELKEVLEGIQKRPFLAGDSFSKRSMSIQDSFDFSGQEKFPLKLSDLDQSQRVLMYGEHLEADHPGFKDNVYRERRKIFYDIAMNYRSGQPIPRVKYTEEETKTWGVVFNGLSELYETHACQEYLENWRELRRLCGYQHDHIPQLADVDTFLRKRTGFQLRPVAGYLSPRDFLAGLAFRVFHCTQYIRHSSKPFYTPEPDCCHELLGHMPLLANASFAEFSQELGLASLGASEEDISKLATCYFFTVEFGLCRENGQLRVYGAGLLSSIDELKHSLTPAAKVLRFDPKKTSKEECIITAFQNNYFYTDTFEEAKEQMRAFADTIQRPFEVNYNPHTKTVVVLDSREKVAAVVSELLAKLRTVFSALRKIQEVDGYDDTDEYAITFAQKLHSALPPLAPRSPSPSPVATNQSTPTDTPTNQRTPTEAPTNQMLTPDYAAN